MLLEFPFLEATTFISELYTGSISEGEVFQTSGILDLPFNEGDKGFTVEDLVPISTNSGAASADDH